MRLSLFDRLSLAAYAVLCAAAGALRLGWLSLRGLETHVQLCLFHLATGRPCPGCGMVHALLFALQGRWLDAWRCHPLGLPVIVAWTASLAWGAANLARGRRFSEGWPALPDGAAWALFALVLAAYAGRLATII